MTQVESDRAKIKNSLCKEYQEKRVFQRVWPNVLKAIEMLHKLRPRNDVSYQLELIK